MSGLDTSSEAAKSDLTKPITGARELKFRAWEKSAHADGAGMMWRPGETFGDYVIHFTGEIYEKFVNSFGGESYDDYRDVSYNFILMQYTGRKDANGKDIYEGDIARYNTGETWLVEWSTRLAAFIYKNKRNKNLNSHEQTMDMHGVEVIGNIHENPELLAPQK